MAEVSCKPLLKFTLVSNGTTVAMKDLSSTAAKSSNTESAALTQQDLQPRMDTPEKEAMNTPPALEGAGDLAPPSLSHEDGKEVPAKKDDALPIVDKKKRKAAKKNAHGEKPRSIRPRKHVSTSSSSPKELARAVNAKLKNNNLLWAGRCFILGKEIGTFGRYTFHTEVQASSKSAVTPLEPIVLDQGSLVTLLSREGTVRIYCAFVAINGNQAQLFVRSDDADGDPYRVSVLDVASKLKDTPPAGFWQRLEAFIESRRKLVLKVKEEEKEARKKEQSKARQGREKRIKTECAASQPPAQQDAVNQEVLQEYRKIIASLESRVKDLEKQLDQKSTEQKILYDKLFEKLCSLIGAGK